MALPNNTSTKSNPTLGGPTLASQSDHGFGSTATASRAKFSNFNHLAPAQPKNNSNAQFGTSPRTSQNSRGAGNHFDTHLSQFRSFNHDRGHSTNIIDKKIAVIGDLNLSNPNLNSQGRPGTFEPPQRIPVPPIQNPILAHSRNPPLQPSSISRLPQVLNANNALPAMQQPFNPFQSTHHAVPMQLPTPTRNFQQHAPAQQHQYQQQQRQQERQYQYRQHGFQHNHVPPPSNQHSNPNQTNQLRLDGSLAQPHPSQPPQGDRKQ